MAPVTKNLQITIYNKKREKPSMYCEVSTTGLPAGTTLLNAEVVNDTDLRSTAVFAKLPDGWYQPISNNGQIFMIEIPDPTTPTDPPVPLPAEAKDLKFSISGVVIGHLFINDEEWVHKA